MTQFLCDCCSQAINCPACPKGAYHMHKKCYEIAKSQGYFAKVEKGPCSHIPTPCYHLADVVHFVSGNVTS